MSTKTEIIVWHPVSEKLPDDDTTVMLSHPQQDEPVWLGTTTTALGMRCKAVCCRNAPSHIGPTCPWGFK